MLLALYFFDSPPPTPKCFFYRAFCVRFLSGNVFSSLMKPKRIADGLYTHDSRILYFAAFSNMLNFGKFIKLSDCPANKVQENTIFHNLMYVSRLIVSLEECKGRYWSVDVPIQLPEHITSIEGLLFDTPHVDFYGEFRRQLMEKVSSVADHPISYRELQEIYLKGKIPIILVGGKWEKEDPRTIIYYFNDEILIRYKPPCWYAPLKEEDERVEDANEIYQWTKENIGTILKECKRTLKDRIMSALNQQSQVKLVGRIAQFRNPSLN